MYQSQVPITVAKAADLKKMAAEYLPPEKRAFYMNLNTTTASSDTESDTEEEEIE